tara:strand:+ start:3977 stop:4243 length:267 start_codon:yes stop_codon:yes gene_type:complete
MTPKPCNRYLLVETIEEKNKKESTVLLPDGFSQTSAFTQAKVLAIAQDCSLSVSVGDVIVFHSSMLQDVKLGETSFKMVLENHVMCSL